MRIGINGFGRIGKNFLKAARARHSDLQVVAINDLSPAADCAHLFKYDSSYGPYADTVTADGQTLVVGEQRIAMTAERDPARIPWQQHGVEAVVECSGLFTDADKARAHLSAGARKVLLSAPGKGVDLTVCMGINDGDYDAAKHHIVSNASCTTNCLAAALAPVVAAYGWQRGFMTTVHSYTNDQNLLDGPHKDLRRARAGAINIIPTSSGAARTLSAILPEVEGKFDGFALRVPTATVSLSYLVAQLDKAVTADALNATLRTAAAKGPLRGILSVTNDPVVSSDLRGSPYSAIVDAALTQSMGDLVQLAVWYDNEWGYACRLADLAAKVAQAR